MRAAVPLGSLLFLSGASALAYQVVWQRQLATVFGVTVYAAGTVLAAFMAGLALGSAAGGRVADRVRRPLLLFAAAEAGVGLAALITPWALGLTDRLYAALAQRVAFEFVALTAARLACSFVLLLPPTVLMGVTLPAALAALGPSAAFQRQVAWLYGTNTLGAFAGALGSGYVLIGAAGLSGTLHLAVAANLAVAAGGLVLQAVAGRRTATAVRRPADAPPPDMTPRQAHTLLAAFGLSGFVALGLEVAWFRMLVAYLPTTTYAFTTMLATVLAGIALGGLLAGRRGGADAPGELARLGGWLAMTGALSLLCAGLLAWTYAAGWRTSGLTQACIVSLLPATTVMGMTYPRGLALWVGASARIGARAGAFAAVNLAGGILGSLAAAFVLVPALGVRLSLLALSSASVVGGLALFAAGRAAPRRARLVFASATALFLAGAATVPDPFASAVGRRHKGEQVLWREEGAQGTVAVHQRHDRTRILYIDSVHQATDEPGVRQLHQRIGLLPLLLHPRPRRALSIGLAGGATPGALALDPAVRVDVVELSRPVVRASAFFDHVNGRLLSRPNVRLRVDDGRNYLSLTGERYDIVTADLVQPFHAGAGHLYSVEYFRLCRRALDEGGLMVQWIGHPPEAHYKAILRTFLDVFPETTLWAEAVLVGSQERLTVEPSRIGEMRRAGEAAVVAAAAGVDTLDGLRSLYTAGPEALRRLAGPGEILSDDRPRVEYFRSLGDERRPIDLSALGRPDARALFAP